MIERKQLNYFVVSADVGSFSEAASVLYTTQSNVSKVVASLEAELGFALFEREGRGVRLTARGRRFYSGANALLSEFEELESESAAGRPDVVRISATSSSWFARKFTEFYKLHEAEHRHYNVHTDTLENIIARLRDMEDEIGFVYVFPDERSRFDYQLKRYQLQFEMIREADGMLYFAPESPEDGAALSGTKTVAQETSALQPMDAASGAPSSTITAPAAKQQTPADPASALRNCRLIQKEQDPFMQYSDWTLEDGTPLPAAAMDIAVVTNSDYIMRDMLAQGGVANISSEAFTTYKNGQLPGARLVRREGRIAFGILTNTHNPVSQAAEEFAAFIRKSAGLVQRLNDI